MQDGGKRIVQGRKKYLSKSEQDYYDSIRILIMIVREVRSGQLLMIIEATPSMGLSFLIKDIRLLYQRL